MPVSGYAAFLIHCISGFYQHRGKIPYLYDATTRRLINRVTPPQVQPKDNVGHSVAVAGSFVVAGAPFDSSQEFQAGAV